MHVCEINYDSERRAIAKESNAKNPSQQWKRELKTSDKILVRIGGRSGTGELRGQNRHISVTLCDFFTPHDKRNKPCEFIIFYNQNGTPTSHALKGTPEDQTYRTNRSIEEIREAIAAADNHYHTV